MDYEDLHNLPLNPTQIVIYKSLCERGPATTRELAKRISKQRSGLYRELKHLETHGFVISHRGEVGVTYYCSVLLEEALSSLADYHFRAVLPIILHQRSKTAAKKHSRRWL